MEIDEEDIDGDAAEMGVPAAAAAVPGCIVADVVDRPDLDIPDLDIPDLDRADLDGVGDNDAADVLEISLTVGSLIWIRLNGL